MKLSRLYTNKPTLFAPIHFRDGLNVVLARVHHPKDPEKHSHCLGKSLLIEVIDFCLLKTLSGKHFLHTQRAKFEDFVFYIEILTHAGAYVTVRRSVAQPTKIAFKRHDAPHQDFTNLPDEGWEHLAVAIKRAKTLLEGFLALTVLKPWAYRKGVSYFLRTQQDYRDVFQLAKYGHGKDTEWKPYLAHIVGLNGDLLTKKYKADDDIKCRTEVRKELEAEVSVRPADFEKLKASIAVKKDEVNTKVSALDRFDFHSQESRLASEVADRLEQEINENNSLLYNAKHDLTQITRSLEEEVHFDLDDVKRVFGEAKLTFPDQLARDYADLVEFNRRILTERRGHLQERAKELQQDVLRLEKANEALAERRRSALQILGGTESLKKYKDLQGQLDHDRATLALMEEKASKLGEIVAIEEELRDYKNRRDALIDDIKQMIGAARATVPRYEAISLHFSRIIKEVLHRTAVFYVDQNGSGNIDLHAEFTDAESDAATEEHRGNTFKQVLCIAFDLALLIAYAGEPFFHFVYHDGGLEQKQGKMKLALLQVIRATCRDYHLQYILSALEEDIPSVEDTQSLCPTEKEIVLELDDSGDSGRLFKMPRF